MTVLRAGMTRTVLLFHRWAVKVPSCRSGMTHFLGGWLGNRTERDRWNWSHQAGRGLGGYNLCPVVGSALFGLVLVMRRAEPVDADEMDCLDLEPLLRITRDVHTDNLGRVDGRVVLVDYA